MTTVANWLVRREPVPPAALAARIGETLGADAFKPVAATADVCLSAAERVLARLVEAGSGTRSDALDLLTADALVTYAIEAAAVDSSTMPERTAHAIRRLAALGASRGE